MGAALDFDLGNIGAVPQESGPRDSEPEAHVLAVLESPEAQAAARQRQEELAREEKLLAKQQEEAEKKMELQAKAREVVQEWNE